nr:immunoglobulin heavy chain junction region [Macaca mulatta]MOX58655.1 immunoglobulin heavy chain junction region [Macaca mulatta]MOX58699.1 immunoglobulin heavy chain junction region [Macaca mulatta]MOX58763.1 immunoglobulin heavy chain junction region [Macaca mulatta]MOX59027.1 immunoglobulin heavy chain junction region [Macaca mulatta]
CAKTYYSGSLEIW